MNLPASPASFRRAPLSGAVALLLLLLGASSAVAAEGAPARRRFALIASANDGGPGRASLRFADSDARTVADVMRALGGVRPDDLVMLPAARRQSLRGAFDRVGKLIGGVGGGTQRELFVYYSGHSDEEGLLLGGERVSYQELRSWIGDAGADVRIAILDSCASGALIRLRGVIRRPSFLEDVSTSTQGHAFLTASSADESAQESDRIGAAFFTHFLVSGMRGAADANRNGYITLNEAYQFAYHETLARTERTVAGAQHPEYDWHLSGKGELVMTSLKETSAGLVLDEKITGRVYVRDASGRLLVELRKEPTAAVELGLPPGEYRVNIDDDGRPLSARVTLVEGRRFRLTTGELRSEVALATTRRGGPVDVKLSPGENVVVASPTLPYRHVPFEAVLAPGVRSGGGGLEPIENNFVLGVVGHSHRLRGVQLSIGGNMVEHDMRGLQIAPGFNLTRGDSRGMQLTSGGNVALGEFRGLQLGDVTNVTMGHMRGVQLSLVNWTGADLRGAQLGVVNYNKGGFRGAQIGVVSASRGESRGAKVAVVGVTGQLRGPVIAVVNVAGEVDGVQLGVVNVARKVRGLQLGVLNVGESVDGASVGVLSIIKDGYHQVALWGSDVMPTNLAFKLGSRHVYTLLGGGLGRTDMGGKDRALFALHAGLGVHTLPAQDLTSDRFFLDVDAISSQFATSDEWDEEDAAAFASLRATAGWHLTRYLSLTAGLSYNVHVRKADSTFERPGLGWLEHQQTSGSYQIRQFPGFLLGMQVGGG
jgi:hypothetical protein